MTVMTPGCTTNSSDKKSSVAESYGDTETVDTGLDNQSQVSQVTQSSLDSAITVRERLPNSRSLLVIPQHLIPAVLSASSLVVNSTLVENAFPTAAELSAWVNEAWKITFRESGEKWEDCTAVCRREVSSTGMIRVI